MQIDNYIEPTVPAISDQNSLEAATKLLTELTVTLDNVTDDKEKLTKPLNESLKAIRAKYKPVEDSLNAAILKIRGAMTSYRQEAIRLQQKELNAIAGRVERGTLKVDTAIKKIEAVEVSILDSKKVDNITFKRYNMYKIINDKIIPREFLTVNDTAIKEYQKLNPKSPPAGVMFYEEERPVVFRK